MNNPTKEIVTNTIKVICAASIGAVCSFIYASNAQAAPNMQLAAKSVACKTLTTLNYAERMLINEPVLEVQLAEVNNSCTTIPQDKDVTAFDIGVTAKVEFFALGKLDVYYVNTRDLISLSEDKPTE
ncbi:TMhelix containing protein [Vibrio phage 1.005.O._10N.286.48.F2]|nr:TMhelix containing protein [Vibrio phage 1.005.O._10N.286.48.F2]